MDTLERQLAERYPHWFRGRRGLVARPLLRGLAQWSRLEHVYGFLDAHAHLAGFALIEAALEFLNLCYDADPRERRRIPASGRLLIVANHPSGALDALALLHLVGSVRSDVKIVANDLLGQIAGLRELLLPVRILGGKPGAQSLAAIDQALREEQCVIVFPAGEVSRLGARGITDTRWRQGFLRFARDSDAPVLPVRIHARNSALFYGAAALSGPVGTALLAREMFKRSGRRIALRVGPVMHLDHAAEPEAMLARVRRTLYSLGRKQEAHATQPQPPIAAVEPCLVDEAVRALQVLGETSDGKRICVGRLRADSPLLREIGRLRETTFRAVGEGTGKALDVDSYDAHYEHIVVWDAAAGKIAGAYRIARGAPVLSTQGLKGLYTASLFRYADEVMPRLAQGMELGRSFVAPEYWGSRSIDYLWQGIGAYLHSNPGVRYLFGAVSLSAALPQAAREQIVAYYARYYGDMDRRAVSRHPFQYRQAPPSFGDMDAETAFRVLKANLDGLGATVPMLYKQYTELCEPGGARFLAFGVDPDFSDSIDGLIEVDLQRLHPKKRARYLQTASCRLEQTA
ncbi:MAG: lysophospholipid acyltransferase family protein [Pseudoxanthomonas sp.]